jgi:FdhE protein
MAEQAAAEIFARRRRRAERLAAEWPFAREVLRFFRSATAAQERMWAGLVTTPVGPASRPDLAALAPFVDAALGEIEPASPDPLREAVARWRRGDAAFLTTRLAATWSARGADGGAGVDDLLARLLLAPHAMRLAPPDGADAGDEPASTCPACGWPPLASVLHEDRDAAAVRRSLVCALCARAWSFPRVLCPGCREERPESLPRYAADEIPWVRIEACDTCHRYLKAVDLPRNPDADPTTDELAALPLDAIARERGYRKIVSNALGV